MTDRPRHAGFAATGELVNYYQPIVDLQTGAILGVETLARLLDGQRLIPPIIFLPGLGPDGLEALLFDSIPPALATMTACDAIRPGLFVSFNVSPCVMLQAGFVPRILRHVAAAQFDPGRITLEILENDEFLSLPAAQHQIAALHESGIHIALDDVGTGYSSLNRLRELAVDKIKLDQAFVRTLTHQPESLHFVAAMLSLARGLHTMLIVEGVETPGIMQALAVLGVQAAQGYAISRPMSRAALLDWVAAYAPGPACREPRSLLGAYASHLSIVEACRALMNQPLPFAWGDKVSDPHACAIGRYFDEAGLHDTPYGHAHKRFHAVVDRFAHDTAAWECAATDLWRTLMEAIKAEADLVARRPVVVPTADAGMTSGPCDVGQR